MKFKFLLTSAILSTLLQSSVNAQNFGDDIGINDINNKVDILNTRFSNLPEEKRRKYLTLRADAHRLFSKKRTFETLMALQEMSAIFDEDPVALNLEGAIYVEFRDFKKARKTFNKAVTLTGDDPKILFNLAELEFCDNQWRSSIKNFKILLEKIKSQQNTDFARLVEFKIMLCQLALSKSEKANTNDEQKTEYLAQAKQLAHKYSYQIDSPYYYYANASIAFYEDRKTTASEWILTAKTVFANNPNMVTSWDDTMVEFGYIEAHYGKHHSKRGESKAYSK